MRIWSYASMAEEIANKCHFGGNSSLALKSCYSHPPFDIRWKKMAAVGIARFQLPCPHCQHR
jgi:hypothetical protein